MDLPRKLYRLVASLTNCRLCRRIALVVFASIFLVEAAILVPSYRGHERELLTRLEHVGRTAIISGLMSSAHRRERDLVVIASTLPRRTILRGGALYRPDGSLIGRFGEPPVLVAGPGGQPSIMSRRSADGARLEVLWPPGATGLPFTVVGRIDSSGVQAEQNAFLWRIGGLVLIISTFVSAVTILILGRELLGPLLRIRRRLVAVSETPALADQQVLETIPDDELGDLLGAHNQLFRRLAKTHREELATMLAMVEGSSNGLIALDRGGDVVYANDAALDLCSVAAPRDLRSDQGPRLKWSGVDDSRPLADVIMHGQATREVTLVRHSGQPLQCILRCATLPEADGTPLRYLAAITDISELHAVYENLERQNVELAASNKAKSEFVANVSHELRTPLNAVIGFSELMLARGHSRISAEDYAQYTGGIHSSGTHLLGIINDILDLSKIEAGMLTLAEEAIDTGAVVADSLRFVAEKAKAANLVLSDRTADRLPGLIGDGRKLKQVLTNLLANAVKFTPPGGRVEVTAGMTDSGGLWIAVSDTGIGIPETELERVFEPFVQVDGSLNRKFEGTGLGLPLSKALVKLHGGTLTMTSGTGHGTVATIELPRRRVAAESSRAVG